MTDDEKVSNLMKGYEREEDRTNVREASKRCTGGSHGRRARFGVLYSKNCTKGSSLIDRPNKRINSSEPYPQTQLLEEMEQDEVEKVLAPLSVNPAETQRRPTYATLTRRS
ncbi:hypothetical protein TNCT_131251 [Trichonephila clavata]|uniref:Uncharacterized protein n=1 Tax=Trichonephila clavata TaxID=2740835 RepID=A0A8X6FNJ8_TRICU|nr:hypothetical protein TNCT_131251 [Trichonephila clavata]